jgi:hypothetical protein
VDVDIEFQENFAHELLPYEPSRALMEDLPNRCSKVGSSFGPKSDERRAGTLGGYVTINGPKQGRYALTCDHVTFPKNFPSPSGYGNRYIQDPANKVAMHQPCMSDLEELSHELEWREKGFQRQVDDFRTKKEQAQEGLGRFTEGAQRFLDLNLATLLQVSHDVHKSKNFNVDFGNVAFSSGQRVLNLTGFYGYRMDWSLVDLIPKRFKLDQRLAKNEVRHFI